MQQDKTEEHRKKELKKQINILIEEKRYNQLRLIL